MDTHFGNHKFAAFIPGLSSGFAGAVVATATNPLWMIKTRLQLQTVRAQETQYKGIADCFLKTVTKEGPLALYRGLGASYFGLVETVIQFSIYENMKYGFASKLDFNLSSGVMLFALSAFSKLVASTLTYPHEVIRTRLREQRDVVNMKYKGPIQGLLLIAREEGTAGLYSGIGPHLLRVVPNAAILLFAYETCLRAYWKFFLRPPSLNLETQPVSSPSINTSKQTLI